MSSQLLIVSISSPSREKVNIDEGQKKSWGDWEVNSAHWADGRAFSK